MNTDDKKLRKIIKNDKAITKMFFSNICAKQEKNQNFYKTVPNCNFDINTKRFRPKFAHINKKIKRVGYMVGMVY